MSGDPGTPQGRPDDEDAAPAPGGAPPTLVEDLLLLLFQPSSGTIAGENTLYFVLGGAVLADLALGGYVTASTRAGSVLVDASGTEAPPDALLRSVWERAREGSRGVQVLLAEIGPTLRQPVLDRLLARGDLRTEQRRRLGLFTTSALVEGAAGRRGALLADVRHALVDGAEPTPRTAALAALLWGSGTLPQFHPEIPWTSAVMERAQSLESANWGAAASGEAVARTLSAIVVGSVAVALAVQARG